MPHSFNFDQQTTPSHVLSLAVSESHFPSVWNRLKEKVNALLEDPRSQPQSELVALYNAVYHMCIDKCHNVPHCPHPAGGERCTVSLILYYHVQQDLQEHVSQKVAHRINGLDADLLRAYNHQWKTFELAMNPINYIFLYLNTESSGRPASRYQHRGEIHPVKEMGYIQWRDSLYVTIKDKMLTALLGQIETDREGGPIDNQLISTTLKSLVSLSPECGGKKATSFYEEQFETAFVDATRVYYTDKVNIWFGQGSVSQTMVNMEKCFEAEARRLQTYLNPVTENNLTKALVEVIVERNRDLLLSEVNQWFDEGRVEDQRRLYGLLKRSEDGLEPLRKLVEDRIDLDGRKEIEAIKNEAMKEPSVFVDTVLSVYRKYEDIVNVVFQKDPQFLMALEKGCKRFINRNALGAGTQGRSAELLAKYCHAVLNPLSKLAKTLAENDLDTKLTSALTLFKLLDDRDVFKMFYSNLLSRRLLAKNFIPDLETAMINRLQQVCGYEYTFKLKRMFVDMETSEDLNKDFSTLQAQVREGEGKDKAGCKMEIQVLTSGSWPLTLAKNDVVMPAELTPSKVLFEEFYAKRHSGRKLTWNYPVCSGILLTNHLSYQSGPYEWQLSMQCMITLLAWNSTTETSLTYGFLDEATKLGEKELTAVLQQMVKAKVLLNEEEKYTPASSFALNFEYKNNGRKVLYIRDTSSKGPDEVAAKNVTADRKHAIQAAIVRLMKSRKSMPHHELLPEVVAQLKSNFEPTVSDIKRNIDALIDKEYLERVDDGYTYLS